jgi:hypothetical protein
MHRMGQQPIKSRLLGVLLFSRAGKCPWGVIVLGVQTHIYCGCRGVGVPPKHTALAPPDTTVNGDTGHQEVLQPTGCKDTTTPVVTHTHTHTLQT